MDTNQHIEKIKTELNKRNLTTTLKHFDQVILLTDQKNWESANSQIRTFLESLFNDVCKLLLNQNKTGGEARKVLQTSGYIDEEQANFIRSFMKLAHTKGAHPGLSNEMETISRWYACISIAILGVSLFPNIIKASDVLTKAGIKIPNVQTITDSLLSCACPTCEERQVLDKCFVYTENNETYYKCKNGCQNILVISKLSGAQVEGRGYYLGDYVLRNADDLYLLVPFGRIVKLSKSPKALRKY